MANSRTARIVILVKAYPQPSQTYQETVCVAGIDLDTGGLIRLYPVPYRLLQPKQRFDRYDCITGRIERASEDPRPESYRIAPESIVIESRGTALEPAEKTRLWLTHISSSLAQLTAKNKEKETSLGIIAPEYQGLRLRATPIKEDTEQSRKLAYEGARQQSLFDIATVKPLMPEYIFRYVYNSGETSHEMQIIDWEVQATWFSYKKKYGPEAIKILKEHYEVAMPAQNLHFVLGNTREHLRNFTIIGLLRSSISPDDATRQGSLL